MHLPALWHFSRMSEQLGNSTHPQVPPDDKTFTIYLNGITTYYNDVSEFMSRLST